MNQTLSFMLACCLTACASNPNNKNNTIVQSGNVDSVTNLFTGDSTVYHHANDTTNADVATYFVVIADTSQDYTVLQKKMFELNKNLSIPIDTMGRYYNKAKNLIVLPKNAEDKIYAGQYVPRRFPSHNFSLEYLNIYQSRAGAKTIALVTGIYEKEKTADSAMTILSKTENKVFKVKSEMYVGCIH